VSQPGLWEPDQIHDSWVTSARLFPVERWAQSLSNDARHSTRRHVLAVVMDAPAPTKLHHSLLRLGASNFLSMQTTVISVFSEVGSDPDDTLLMAEETRVQDEDRKPKRVDGRSTNNWRTYQGISGVGSTHSADTTPPDNFTSLKKEVRFYLFDSAGDQTLQTITSVKQQELVTRVAASSGPIEPERHPLVGWLVGWF
jgi:hypothetical protein